MGASESRNKDPDILNVFTAEETSNLHQLFLRIVGNQQWLTKPFLEKYTPAWFPEKDKLFKVICDCQVNQGFVKDKRVSEKQFGGFLAECLKGSSGEKADILCLLCDQVGGEVAEYRLFQTVATIVRCYLELSQSDKPLSTWKCTVSEDDISRLSRSILNIEKVVESETKRRSQYDVETWLAQSPFFIQMFDRVFYNLFPILAREMAQTICKSFLPEASNVDWSKTRTILDTISLSYLNFHIPRTKQLTWRLLYSNTAHGDSFSQLTHFIVDKGPNVFIVRDKEGFVFGAYVAEDWQLKGTFYGDESSFLFTLKPRYGIYPTTGYNENYMYLNQGQETLPNGLGFGGQLNYFGLWIDSSFNRGHSKAQPKCTTYGSPQLSGSPEFLVDSLEVWAVGPEKKKTDSDDEEGQKTSILDKDVTGKAILELAGKKQHSEGIRELHEDAAPMTEEEKRKMNTIPKLL